MQLFDNLLGKLTYIKDKSQIEQIQSAYIFAREAHEGQTRDSGEPYFTHPIAVALILASMQLDYQSIIAAFLHDVVEDTHISNEVVKKKFGKTIAELVDSVTKLSQLEFLSHAEVQAESFRKMLLAMSSDIRVILIKLADRLHNMQTLHALPAEKRYRIAKETLDIYAPIANRLGMHNFYIELEELSFVAFYPFRYRILINAMKKLHVSVQKTVTGIESEIKQGLAKSSMENAEVFVREKHLYSIYKRMQKQHNSFADATNSYTFRIIVADLDSCYRALGVVHGLYKPIPGKFEDYIARPKSNGYQSLHTSLFGPKSTPIEIQIRTQEMDQIANFGIIMHWLGNKSRKTDETQIHAARWLNDLLEMQQNASSSLEFIENIKRDLFPDEIYVFTPKGNIVELPQGATVLDFAYMVHTDIGNTCTAAMVDNQFVPLSTTLTSGQTVSIITTPEAKPDPVWLNFAITGKARGGIHHFLRSQQRPETIELGKHLLAKALSELDMSLKQVPSKTLNELLSSWHFKNLDELYEDIGLGNRIVTFVAHQFLSAITTQGSEITKDKISAVTKATPLLIKGAEGMAINFASCCYPIPGDAIVGYLQVGKGLVVHREDCSNLIKLKKKPEMYIPVSWDEDLRGEFHVAINVEMANQKGVLASLGQAIAKAESNIEDIQIKERASNYFLALLLLTVKNHAHFERVLRYLKNIPEVIGVSRAK